MSAMMIFEVLHGSKSNHLKLNENMVSTLNEICNSTLKINFLKVKTDTKLLYKMKGCSFRKPKNRKSAIIQATHERKEHRLSTIN